MKGWKCLLAGSLGVLLPATAMADLSVYLDKQGVSHFRLDATPGSHQLFRPVPALPPDKAPVVPARSPEESVAVQAIAARHPATAGRSAAPPPRVAVKGKARIPAAAPYAAVVDRAARAHGVEAALIHAVITVESGYRPTALSPKGAAGLMQLMPATARRFGIRNRLDPAQNVAAGTRYLKLLMQRFGGNVQLALAAYNAGEGTVARYGNRIPPFPETQAYVQDVLAQYRRMRAG